MIDPWRHALDAISRGAPASLLVVVDHRGSVPGKTGAVAVVSADGLAGTIGGGAAENELADRARALAERSVLVRYEHTSEENDSLCSGSQRVAILRLDAGDQEVLRTIVDTLDSGGLGCLQLTAKGLSFEPGTSGARAFSGGDDGWSFSDTLGRREILHIVGGGHVSLALSRIVATLPFRIVVLDDRDDVPTMRANHYADETRVIDYGAVADHVTEGEHSWVTIMTHGHRADAEVLRQLVGRPLRYLGMMGSTAKVAQIRTMLLAQGVSEADLDRVVAPIGLPIGSHSPEEIAISIAAQLIQFSKTS